MKSRLNNWEFLKRQLHQGLQHQISWRHKKFNSWRRAFLKFALAHRWVLRARKNWRYLFQKSHQKMSLRLVRKIWHQVRKKRMWRYQLAELNLELIWARILQAKISFWTSFSAILQGTKPKLKSRCPSTENLNLKMSTRRKISQLQKWIEFRLLRQEVRVMDLQHKISIELIREVMFRFKRLKNQVVASLLVWDLAVKVPQLALLKRILTK